jgi:hypothetical protein
VLSDEQAPIPAGHPEHDCPGTGRCAGGHLKPEQRATTDPELIYGAWTARPYNIGLATGPAGLVVVDLDRPKDGNSEKGTPCGVTTFRALCERAGQPVPHTRTIRTASGGRHLYFTAPAGVELRNTAGRLGPLIDTRAHGGYVVAPGSTTPAGTYEVTDPAPVAPLPAWLTAALAPSPVATRRAVPVPVLDGVLPAYVQAALDNERCNVATAAQGQRNSALVRAARALGRFVAAGQLSRAEVEEALSGAAEAAGQKPYEYQSALTSSLNWSIANNPGPVTR